MITTGMAELDDSREVSKGLNLESTSNTPFLKP